MKVKQKERRPARAGPTVLASVCCYLLGFLVFWPCLLSSFSFPLSPDDSVGEGAFCQGSGPRDHFPLFSQRAVASPAPAQPGAAQQSPQTAPNPLSSLRQGVGPGTLP